jgi:transposase
VSRPKKRTQEEIDKAVERYVNGESVEALCREYNISRAGFYLWVNKAKQAATTQLRLEEIGENGLAVEERIKLELENRPSARTTSACARHSSSAW